jgi:nucleotide-binding universal stress UspA family protein
MNRRVIIGYDGSAGSEDALRFGKQLCEAVDATPLVASCILWPRYLFDPPKLSQAVEEDTRPLLERAVKRLAPLEAETCSVYEDSAAMALEQLAADIRPFAVVVGSAHRGAVGQVLLGSTGASLLSGCSAAVVVVPRGYAENVGEHLLRVGVAVDGGEESVHALNRAVDLAQRLHATLTIVGVITPTPVGYGTVAGASLGDLMRSQREHFARAMEDAADRVPRNLPVTLRRFEGSPAAMLAEASADVDLLVVGSRGHGPLRRALLGSVSRALTEHAHCPLVVVPRGAGAPASSELNPTGELTEDGPGRTGVTP